MTSFLKGALSDALTKAETVFPALAVCSGARVAEVFRGMVERMRKGERVERSEVEVLKEVCWEKLHTGHWQEVRVEWRDAYALAQLCHVAICVLHEEDVEIDEMLKELDLAIVMGGHTFRPEVEKLLREMGRNARKRKGVVGKGVEKKVKREVDSLPLASLKRPPGRSPPQESSPSLEYFSERYLSETSGSEPCVLEACVKTWPAFHKWQNLEYFHERFGYRMVPVELGRHYLAEKWSQKMMAFSDFLDQYVVPDTPPEEKGYLAQHPLFDQIPELKEDLCVPEYCYLSTGDKEPLVHAWFGPKGTVSPLHYDRSHNILAQVRGRKYIRLYAPVHSSTLRPIPTFINKNSSEIDLDDEEQVRRYGMEEVEFVDCILEPGDALFIPRGWWHYVRSLDVSLSVSFWWDSL